MKTPSMQAAPAPQGRLAKLSMQLSRDKADTLLLLTAILLVLAPHATHLPAWISALCATTLAWRATVTFRGHRMPPSWILVPLAMGAMGGVYLSFNTLLGRDAGVAMAVLLVTFKMLEMHARRDLFVVIFLGFFLILTNFFYSQSIGTGLMMVVSIVFLLTAQLSFQYTGAVPSLKRRLLQGAKILALAAPLALLMFVLFPRIQGPLWGMPGDAMNGRTGLSNNMAPGNISALAQSAEVAFRVRFLDKPPAQGQLYWRALVLDNFDGRTWTQPRRDAWRRLPAGRTFHKGTPLRYEVTLEPHGQRWLFALDLPGSVPLMTRNEAGITDEYELRAASRIGERVRYEASSYLGYWLDIGYSLADSAHWLRLPPGFNPRATQAGLELQAIPNPAQRVTKVLAQFREQPYSYTLQPPALGQHSVDEFLYQTRAGFCEHYASAFVFLMRAAGVPARVVTGYQGGELNPIDGFMEVRQSDAHAWAEVWLPGRGWVRIDPTAAVAPERVERNLARALPAGEQFNLESLGSLINVNLDRNSWLAQLRFRLGAVNNGWNQWVLNYDSELRRGVLDSLGDAVQNWRYLTVAAALALLLAVARVLRKRSGRDPVDTLYSALCLQLSRLGLARGGDEGPNAYALRIAGADIAPRKKDAILRFLQLYSAHKYGAEPPDGALVPILKRLLNTSR